ncbi:MAG: LPS export ABC transporter periplasmic protein LptC [Omnitrophica bacterium RIFCSPHIGHO2_02_FULL_46_11]|nr:MAG: LPS export ABC transporter periplasmic protein LptC [Omnitrophica bacterium RIFCSPHIGHO2_02_FULL_46_11]OGW87652.1 MAG: LPS export ABC transporter periplasmic protein LptC [Omnitrophica bacterium RIFCSPLOWO2_01_FULL_45_10b]
MIRKLILACVILVLAYVALIQFKIWMHTRADRKGHGKEEQEQKSEVAQRVYSFSFSKYTDTGEKELEIEGDSADIFSQNVALINVIAKAYAEESPVTITADQGSIDRSTSDVQLHKNVVATTENGTRLMTDQLNIHPSDKRMDTDSEAKVKKDNINIEGTGASSDSQLSKVTFKKNVTVVVQDPDSESKVPTVITSDGPLEVDYKRNIAHFSKNVVAHHAQGTLNADYMDVIYEKDTRKVSKIVARGNVIIVSKEGNKTYSDIAVYLAKEGRVVLGGDVDAKYRSDESGLGKSLF